MTAAAIVARVDADAVQELMDLREEFPTIVRDPVFGLAWLAAFVHSHGDLSDDALALAEQLDDPLAFLESGKSAPFSEAYPALAAWKTAELAKPRHLRDPLTAAAAHEVQAIEAERVGADDAAQLARQAAQAALRSRRRSA